MSVSESSGDGSRESVGISEYALSGVGAADPGLPTFFVFLDLRDHIEFRAPNVPLLPEGTTVEFDLNVTSVRDPLKKRVLKGAYTLQRRVLKFGGKRPGLTQYLEWKSV